MNEETSQVAGGLKPLYQSYKHQKCFVGHSHEAPWCADIVSTCEETLSEFGLETWYAAHNFDPTRPLRDKVVEMIANARYGIYDLSYWRRDKKSEWEMPRNVLIELGMAIVLNRPTLLLRHAESRRLGPKLPECLESVSEYILEFSGESSLKRVLRERLPQWVNAPPQRDWWNRYCIFGSMQCRYREAHPRAEQWGQEKLHCHISDSLDVDRLDFREVVGKVLERFNDVEFNYLDTLPLTNGYNFLLCTHCQTVRSTPFAIYRITPETTSETFIAIGMSIALEKQFEYKIPKILLTANMQDVPSLLAGYEVVLAQNDQDRKNRLREFIPVVIQKVRETTWRQRPLPFEVFVSQRDDKSILKGELLDAELAPPALPKDFFISYTSADREWAEWIAWLLEQEGYKTVTLAWDFMASSNFVQEMNAAIRTAERIIAVLSPDYVTSSFASSEWADLFRQDPKGEQHLLIPVRVRPCDVEGLLGSIIYIDLVGLDEPGARTTLLAGLGRGMATPTTAPSFPRRNRDQQTTSQRTRFPGEPLQEEVSGREGHYMRGIPIDILNRLRETLLECSSFDSDHQLQAVFANDLLIPWRNRLPRASSPTNRVDAVINFLMDKRRAGTQMSALVLLLSVLRDQTAPEDTYYARLTSLLEDLNAVLQGSPSSIKTTIQPSSSIATPQPSRTGVFISYSHKDANYVQRLKLFLRDYSGQGLINVWDDMKNPLGANWLEEMKNSLGMSKVAVLLLSADFFASDFINEYELPILLDNAKAGEIKLISVILSPCDFHNTPLSSYQSVNPPSRPLKKMSRVEQDKVWETIRHLIRDT